MKLFQNKNLILLHLIIIIWGFTGILGKLITIPSEFIVWNRMIIAWVTLSLINIFLFKNTFPKNKKAFISYLFIGLLIAIHWICFFEAIEQSTVSLALICLSSISLFTSLLEPLIQWKKKSFDVLRFEILLSLLVIVGIAIIYRYEVNSKTAIFLGVSSAFFGALFTLFNHKLMHKNHKSMIISSWEMFGGGLFLTIYLLITKTFNSNLIPQGNDLLYILILGVICTAFAFAVSVEIMKKITPFTMNLTVNLEPIYTIILALVIFGESEQMTTQFYIGGGMIICSVFINTIFNSKKN